MISALCVSESLRPRGVPPDMANFYDPNSNFHCLDGSGEIPFEHVNDDYCDCKVCKLVYNLLHIWICENDHKDIFYTADLWVRTVDISCSRK